MGNGGSTPLPPPDPFPQWPLPGPRPPPDFPVPVPRPPPGWDSDSDSESEKTVIIFITSEDRADLRRRGAAA
ncbi:unnamed protein product [Camellia sinensis]